MGHGFTQILRIFTDQNLPSRNGGLEYRQWGHGMIRKSRIFTEQPSRNQKNSPQRRGGGPVSWERTLPACNSNPMATTCTPEACGPRKTRKKFFPDGKEFPP